MSPVLSDGASPSVDFVDGANDVLEVRFSGVLAFEGPWSAKLATRLGARGGRPVRLDLSAVESIDGGAMALLVEVRWGLVSAGAECDWVVSTPAIQRLLELSGGNEEPAKRPTSRRPGVLHRIGEQAANVLESGQRVLSFVGCVAVAVTGVVRRPRSGNFPAVAPLLSRMGADAVPIVLLINFLIGLVMGFQSAVQLKQFGANIYVANLVGLSITRELGPLMTAIIVSGRSGAAIAAELGAMTVSEEVDALRTLGLDPHRFLVIPRVVALLLAVPILTLMGDVVGVAGGLIVAVISLDLTATAYLNQTQRALGAWDVLQGLIKSAAFAFVIGHISCQQGLATSRGAEGVGRSTTTAVVASLFSIILIDAAFTVLFHALGL